MKPHPKALRRKHDLTLPRSEVYPRCNTLWLETDLTLGPPLESEVLTLRRVRFTHVLTPSLGRVRRVITESLLRATREVELEPKRRCENRKKLRVTHTTIRTLASNLRRCV
jgi:hypothetical protein